MYPLCITCSWWKRKLLRPIINFHIWMSIDVDNTIMLDFTRHIFTLFHFHIFTFSQCHYQIVNWLTWNYTITIIDSNYGALLHCWSIELTAVIIDNNIIIM